MCSPRWFCSVVMLFYCMSASLYAQETNGPASLSDTRALALYDGMVNAFRAAKSLTFTSTYALSVGDLEMGRCSYHATLKKPGYLLMEAFDYKGRATGKLVGNEDGFWIAWPNGRPRDSNEDSTAWAASRRNVYMHQAIPASHYSVAHATHWIAGAVVMAVVELSMFHGSPDGLAAEREGVRIVKREEVDGVPCTLIEVSYLDHQRSKLYWLGDRDLLPRKAMDVVRAARQLTATEVWTDLRLNEQVPPRAFAWSPPVDWMQWFPASDQASLLPPGTLVPDFACKTLDGKTFHLSAHRGKPMLLNFWRLGCPPCRREVVALARLHQQYAGKGLCIVGFNCADDRKRVMAFLQERAVPYINILDTSAAAVEVYAKAFRTTATPTNYAIDKEGKIVDSWIGSDEGRLALAIKRLGLP